MVMLDIRLRGKRIRGSNAIDNNNHNSLVSSTDITTTAMPVLAHHLPLNSNPHTSVGTSSEGGGTGTGGPRSTAMGGR
jgi:hypothetical protein